MAYGTILLLLVIIGLAMTFRVEQPRRRGLWWSWLLAALLAGGGCAGALGWVGAETSGRDNLFHMVNPLVWTGLFVAGAVMLVMNAVRVFSDASRPRRGEPRSLPRDDDTSPPA